MTTTTTTDNALKYIPHASLPPPAPFSAPDELLTSLTRLITHCPPRTPWRDDFKNTPRGLWTGPTSIAYLFLHLSLHFPSLSIPSPTDPATKSPAEWCATYLACGQSDLPLLTNESGIKNERAAFLAVSVCLTKDEATIARFLEVAETLNKQTRADYNDYLSGRAGLLFLLRLVRSFVPSSAAAVTAAMAPVISHILDAANRPWTFNDVRYIGAGHGSLGILTQLVLSDSCTAYSPEVESELESLLDQQLDSGHWYVRASLPDEAELVQWCHGAPGFVISLLAIRACFPSARLQGRIDKAIELGRRDTWERGVLRKEPNLCHGVAGNALALVGEERRMFMGCATRERIEAGLESGEFVRGDDKWGLGWGEAGRSWAWMVMAMGRDEAYFAAYTDV